MIDRIRFVQTLKEYDIELTEKQLKDYYMGANWVSFPKTTKKRNPWGQVAP